MIVIYTPGNPFSIIYLRKTAYYLNFQDVAKSERAPLIYLQNFSEFSEAGKFQQGFAGIMQ